MMIRWMYARWRQVPVLLEPMLVPHELELQEPELLVVDPVEDRMVLEPVSVDLEEKREQLLLPS